MRLWWPFAELYLSRKKRSELESFATTQPRSPASDRTQTSLPSTPSIPGSFPPSLPKLTATYFPRCTRRLGPRPCCDVSHCVLLIDAAFTYIGKKMVFKTSFRKIPLTRFYRNSQVTVVALPSLLKKLN